MLGWFSCLLSLWTPQSSHTPRSLQQFQMIHAKHVSGLGTRLLHLEYNIYSQTVHVALFSNTFKRVCLLASYLLWLFLPSWWCLPVSGVKYFTIRIFLLVRVGYYGSRSGCDWDVISITNLWQCARVCVCVYVCVYVHVHVHAHVCACACVRVCEWKGECVYECVCISMTLYVQLTSCACPCTSVCVCESKINLKPIVFTNVKLCQRACKTFTHNYCITRMETHMYMAWWT